MEVNSATSGTGGTGSTSSTRSITPDYNTFLQLLITQMRNQDPTSPMETSEYMNQFAQLSAVEQAVQTNTKLESLLSSSALAQADGLIGRTATFTGEDGAETTGVIKEVIIVTGGAVAHLEDGTKVYLGPGVTIS